MYYYIIFRMLIPILFFIAIFMLKMMINVNTKMTKPTKNRIHNVTIYDKTFFPKTLNIKSNDSVKFMNNDLVRHQIICDNYNIPNTNLLNEKDSFVLTIYTPGRYVFYSPFFVEMQRCIIYVK
jgi:plastocyanin